MKTFSQPFVRKLTRLLSGGGITTLFLMATGPGAYAATSEWQPISDIARAAEEYLIRHRIGPSARRTSVRAGALDVRLKLPRCDRPLEAFMRHGAVVRDRTIVGVRCAGVKPWKVYVPVNVVVTAKVIVARQPLSRGHLLTAEDLVAEDRDVTRSIRGYFTDASQLVGHRVKSPLLPGSVITPSVLEADKFVRRGQTVTLVVQGGGIDIAMAGKALADGALNQRIKVENLNSGRVVEGIVRSKEHVEVLMAPPSSFFNAKPKVSPTVADTRSSQQ